MQSEGRNARRRSAKVNLSGSEGSILRTAQSEVVVVPGRSHERIVPTLSRDGQTAGPAMLRFIRRQQARPAAPAR